MLIDSGVLDMRSWERFRTLLSIHGKVGGRLLIISNADTPELLEGATFKESSINRSEFKQIEGFILDLDTGAGSTVDISSLENSASVNGVVLPPSFVIIDLLKLPVNRLLYITNYFSQIAVPVVLYSGTHQAHIDPNFLIKMTCYCYISMNSLEKVSVLEILRQYIQTKITLIKSPELNKTFITHSFFEKVSRKWHGVVYGIQTKKKRKKSRRDWKARLTKRYDEFNKKKP